MKLTIVGQAPGRSRNKKPFDGASGRRLARLAGLGSYAELAARVRLVNLLARFPGKLGKGDAFPRGAAAAALGSLRLRGTILLAGRNVAAAFGLRTRYFAWTELRGKPCAVLPHPSGISHWWNEPKNVRRASSFLRSLVRRHEPQGVREKAEGGRRKAPKA